MKLKRLVSALLLLAMLLSCLPFSVLAADGENYFYFSAETSETLVVSPKKIPYSADQTISEALADAGVELTFDGSSGFVTAIQGILGNYLYFGDFSGTEVLTAPASSVRFLFFTEDREAALTAGRMALMQVMSDYLDKPADVQAAAKAAYDEALTQYPGQTEAEAAALAQTLADAIRTYEDSLTDRRTVLVQVSEENCVITAVNEYGREFSADGNALSLPTGTYTIEARAENRVARRENVAVPGTSSVSLTLPEGNWFDEAGFQISRTYDSLDAEEGVHFKDGLCATELENHVLVAQIPDAYAGELYPYVPKAGTASQGLAMTVSYRKTDGSMVTDKAFTAGSYVSSLSEIVRLGTEGNEAVFRLSREAEDCVQSMELKLVLARVPTLKVLRVENAEGIVQAADLPFSALEKDYTYKIVQTSAVKLRMEATTVGSTIAVTSGGKTFSPEADGCVTVPVAGDTEITVTVSSGSYTTDYTLRICPGSGKIVKFSMDPAISMTLVNQYDEELGYTTVREGSKKTYTYTLVPGETYSYAATKDVYYHSQKTFTLDKNAENDTRFTVDVPTENLMKELALGSASGNKNGITLSPAFQPATHSYTATVSDATNLVFAWASLTQGSISAIYPVQSTSQAELPEKMVELTSGDGSGKRLYDVLLSGSGHGNTLTFRAAQYDGDNDVTNYVDYVVELQRALSLRGLTASLNGVDVPLYHSDGSTTGYSRTESTYSVRVPAAANALDLTIALRAGSPKYGEADTGYSAAVNGQSVPADGKVSVPLRGDRTEEAIRIVLTNRYAPEAKTEYTILVQKAPATAVSFDVTPADALVYLYERTSGSRVWPEGSSFALSEGFTYQYTVTKAGYVGQSGTLTLANGVLTLETPDGTKEYTDFDHIPVTLKQAAKDSLTHDLEAEWPDFRGGADNNAVTDAPIPIYAEDGTLYWAVQLGTDQYSGAVSNPILVDGALIVYAGDQIYRIDKDTGETLASGQMAGSSAFAINGPTYADGMILVGLMGGMVQAFDAVTLESLWVYTDPLRGQPNCPITVAGGYAYTGFWNAEDKNGSFVCLSLTDEDPTKTNEAKYVSWRHVQDGGFYWAGAYACENFVMVGTDDGKAGCSYLYLLDPQTGAVLDSRAGFDGDIRSTIVYDAESDAYYFTSKGGSFYRVRVTAENGTPALSACDALKLDNGTNGPQTQPMSTSTPVVYNGRAYIGVCGTGQFTDWSGHSITVIDLGEELSIAYRVETKGYPQTSGLLTTAYEGSGYVYVYFFENDRPGTMRVLRDRAGQMEADTTYCTLESAQGTTHRAAYALFSPVGEQAQNAICSPIADTNGTVYFKNDSGYLMAYGSALKQMTITTNPKKTEYAAGDTFQPKGLVVMGEFVNGVTRDVTKMLSFPTTPIRAGDAAVSAEFGGDLKMYHNESDGNGGMKSGVATRYAPLEIPITVSANAGGTIDTLKWRYDAQSGTLRIEGSFDGRTLIAACYDAAGKMTAARLLTEAGSCTLDQKSARITLFLLSADGRPVCAAKNVIQPEP